MAQSNLTLAVRYAAVDVVGSFLYFPIWWYGPGLVRTGRFCAGTVRDYARQFGIAVWVKNLFVPMFGQHDVVGRLISFFLRLVVILYYSLVLAVLSVLMLAVFAAWVLFPVLVVWQIAAQAVGLLAPAV
jgi:hypothetical protein